MFGFRKGKLRPTWQYSTNQVFWRVIPTGVGKLICEIRDLDQKRVHFLSINQTTGVVEWDSVFGEDWWIGIETVHRGVLFLHKFASPDMPEHRSVIAASIQDGKVIWREDEFRFEGVGGGGAYVSVLDRMRGRFVEVDIYNGRVRTEFDSYDAMHESIRASQNEPRTDILFPAWNPDTSGLDSTLQRFCDAREVVGPVEHITYGDHMICSHHERSARSSHEQPVFDTSLHVVKNGKVVFSHMLNRDAPTFMQGNFFVEGSTLFFIKDRSTLTAVRLHTTNNERIR